MTNRKMTMWTNIIMVSVTLLTVLLISATGNAQESFNSQGKIIFSNRTEDISDDVIFDAGDFNKLAYICR